MGVVKTYDIDQATNRGKFSSELIENAWNRMFWMRVYTERIRMDTSIEEQTQAWQKYIDASEKWSSNIMNYYLGLEDYYPNTDKRKILEYRLQPKFIKTAQMIARLKYSIDVASRESQISKVDSIQNIVNDLNYEFYFLIDQPFNK